MYYTFLEVYDTRANRVLFVILTLHIKVRINDHQKLHLTFTSVIISLWVHCGSYLTNPYILAHNNKLNV